ncbi:MAG: hypothetical protein EXR99_14530 [Gemmataceae bacterium]|nr:hypothetical protein [Gemmataceae bacterium]
MQPPIPPDHQEHSFNPLGIFFFLIYVGMYGLFIFLNSFMPSFMGAPSFLGLNRSVAFGFLLIFGAVFLAFLYNQILSGQGKGRRA